MTTASTIFDENLLSVVNTTTQVEPSVTPLVSYRIYNIISLINDHLLTCPISFFGIFTNSANIAVFLKMGFAESTNISFFALSVIDLLVSLYTLIGKLLYSPVLFRLHGNFKAIDGGRGMTSIIFATSGVGGWVTTIISLERCFCIMFPLKVKTIITRRRIVLLILVMTVYQATFACLIYAQTGPPYHQHSEKRIIYLLCSLTGPSFICFVIVVIATTFLVIKLKQTMKMRSQIASQSDKAMSKERKVVRPVIFICVIFIVCFLPNVAKLLGTIVFPRLTPTDPYFGSLSNVLYTFTFIFQSISSSINIFVYYHMSSKFKETFGSLFCQIDVNTGGK
ncbi:hypothetical protein RRG08_059506 [Elysia crispata]|uniref:G-protein coupled receptors family 1 profile domain-containing protein n=1 Tax=Elysia crispata TaxID=231223 RepID=A0AAE1AU95_9GAST|nr:hypothetical protein RRG08_059506 [Elysia crispata]